MPRVLPKREVLAGALEAGAGLPKSDEPVGAALLVLVGLLPKSELPPPVLALPKRPLMVAST